jgi:hypothetical protein
MHIDKEQRTKFNIVCRRMANGKSLREACKMGKVPIAETIRVWLRDDESGTLPVQYARACDERAGFHADEIIAIADEAKDANKARVQIEARKWVASKLDPKKYGDKQTLDVNHGLQLRTPAEAETAARFMAAKFGVVLPVLLIRKAAKPDGEGEGNTKAKTKGKG